MSEVNEYTFAQFESDAKAAGAVAVMRFKDSDSYWHWYAAVDGHLVVFNPTNNSWRSNERPVWRCYWNNHAHAVREALEYLASKISPQPVTFPDGFARAMARIYGERPVMPESEREIMGRDKCSLINRIDGIMESAYLAMNDVVRSLDCGEPIQFNSDHYVALKKAMAQIKALHYDIEKTL